MPARRRTSTELPFSRAAAGPRVGARWLDRVGWRDPGASHEGILDSIDVLESPGFDPAAVAAPVRDFYEHASRYQLRIRSAPRWWFRPALAAYGLLARVIGQTEFPRAGTTLENHFVALAPHVDDPRRRGARAWVRTHGARSERVLYVILISWHGSGAGRYMHTAVPMPGGNIASVMHMSTSRGGAICHDTREPNGQEGPAGVYFATRVGVIRLPIGEHLCSWPALATEAPEDLRAFALGADVAARHVFRLFGARILTLDYAFTRC